MWRKSLFSCWSRGKLNNRNQTIVHWLCPPLFHINIDYIFLYIHSCTYTTTKWCSGLLVSWSICAESLDITFVDFLFGQRQNIQLGLFFGNSLIQVLNIKFCHSRERIKTSLPLDVKSSSWRDDNIGAYNDEPQNIVNPDLWYLKVLSQEHVSTFTSRLRECIKEDIFFVSFGLGYIFCENHIMLWIEMMSETNTSINGTSKSCGPWW